MQQQIYRQMRARYERFQKTRQAFDPGASAWYRINAEDQDVTDVYIYDAIGFFGVEAEEFVQDFDKIETSKITLRINSPGGDIFDGMAIYNSVKRHPATVTTEIDGVAASMASIIALAGDTVNMSDFGLFMMHEPWSMVMGSAEDMRTEADLLDKVNDQGVAIYTQAGNWDESAVRAAMSLETWFTAKEALDAGFIHSISESTTAPSELFDLSIFDNAPRSQGTPEAQRDAVPSRRSLEQCLRDGGLSRKQAKALLASYTIEDERDASLDEMCRDTYTMAERLRY